MNISKSVNDAATAASVEYLPDRVQITLPEVFAGEHKLGRSVAIKSDKLHYRFDADAKPEKREMPWPADVETSRLPPAEFVVVVQAVLLLDMIKRLAEEAA